LINPSSLPTQPISTFDEATSHVPLSVSGVKIESKNGFAAVDAARGLAAGIVFIHHLTVFFPGAFETILGRNTLLAQALNFLSNLNTEAVMLFFVVSGFCIRSSSKKADFGRLTDVLNYGRRRFARIVPLYWLALAFTGVVGMILGLTADRAFSFETLFGNLIFLQSSESARGTWFVPYGLNGPLWSISYEVFYYVLFPFAIIVEHWLGIRSAVVSLVAAFVFSLGALVAYNVAPNPILLFAAYYFVWRLGVCAFDVLRNPGESRLALIFAIGAAVGLSVIIAGHASANLSNIRNGTVISAVWVAAQSWPKAKTFVALLPVAGIIGGLARLGGISYGLYLLHHPLLRLTSTYMGDTVIGLVLAIAAAIIFAALAEAGGARAKQLILGSRIAFAPKRVTGFDANP
jgi:peptidoglycan/LPS O-acetylase OafA/YrhL